MDKIIFVAGATGFVGNNLIPLLLEIGCRVRVLMREEPPTVKFPWISRVEVVRGDLLSPESLSHALGNVSTAFYLVHNMSYGSHYESREVESARNFARAAQEAGVGHIIYLGGLAHPGEKIGAHMLSRIQTGESLRSGTVPVTEFRASLVIGPGSTSFEMIRNLTELFPLLVGPRELKNMTQPIAIADVVAYLVAAMDCSECKGRIFEIGGSESMAYIETLQAYASMRGLKRKTLLLPWIPIGIMASLVSRLTPTPQRLAKPLIGGMRGSSVVYDDSARQAFPSVIPIGYQQALRQALDQLQPDYVVPAWDPTARHRSARLNGFFIEEQELLVGCKPERVSKIIFNIGGKNGWLYLNGLWQLRGLLDRLAGGPGMRGRNSTDTLTENDIVDYYRVERSEPGSRLRLRAELKAPGQGWMEWRITSAGEGTRLTQTAFFAPRGLAGVLYWYSLKPVHALVFHGLIRAVARKAMESSEVA